MAGTIPPHDTPRRANAQARHLHVWIRRRPWATLALLLGAGMLCGAAVRSAIGLAEREALRAAESARQAELDRLRRDSQRESDGLAARLAELHAQVSRQEARASRLARAGQLDDRAFEADGPPGRGGDATARDMPPADLQARLSALAADYRRADARPGMLEAWRSHRQFDRSGLPSPLPGAGRGGHAIGADHGNGPVPRYARNARPIPQTGDLVRAGPALAGVGFGGHATGSCAQFEPWQDGVERNPRKFLGHHKALARHGPALG